MFGVFDSSSLPIILVTRAYLHLCARRNERIYILALKNSLSKQFVLENYIAKKNHKTASFEKITTAFIEWNPEMVQTNFVMVNNTMHTSSGPSILRVNITHLIQ